MIPFKACSLQFVSIGLTLARLAQKKSSVLVTANWRAGGLAPSTNSGTQGVRKTARFSDRGKQCADLF